MTLSLRHGVELNEDLELSPDFTDLDSTEIVRVPSPTERELLWRKGRRRGLGDSFLGILRAVAIAGARSDCFALPSGVLQGSLLSPELYSIFIDNIFI